MVVVVRVEEPPITASGGDTAMVQTKGKLSSTVGQRRVGENFQRESKSIVERKHHHTGQQLLISGTGFLEGGGGGDFGTCKCWPTRACVPPRTPLPRWVSLVLVVHKAAWQSTGQGVRGSRAASSIRPHHTYFFSTLIHCISICSSH